MARKSVRKSRAHAVTRLYPGSNRVARRRGSKASRRASRKSRGSSRKSYRRVGGAPYLKLTKAEHAKRSSHRSKCGARCYGNERHMRYPLCQKNCKFDCNLLKSSYKSLVARKEKALATKVYNKALRTACAWIKQDKKSHR